MAADFNIDVTRVFTLETDGSYKVHETQHVKNNSPDLLISKNNQVTFTINVVNSQENLQKSLDSVVITAGGASLAFTSVIGEKSAELKVNYPHEIRKGESLAFDLVYINFGLVEQKGALYDVYAPGFVEDTQFEKGQISFSYLTTIKIANSFPQHNIALPVSFSYQEDEAYRIYAYSQDALLGNTIWIQLGQVQYYEFVLTQTSHATDSVKFGFDNEYSLIIPRDIEEGYISQKVYYTSISPEPLRIEIDADGNMIAVFKVPSNINSLIEVKGFAEVSIKDVVLSAESSTTFEQIPAELVAHNTHASKYWEVDASEIQEQATALKLGQTNVYQVVEDTYSHMINTIDYSQVKRFGINERQGALATLQGGAAVCMEYSDLFLTLSRAQGIPARAAFGYGYDSRLDDDAQEAHQWVQVYMPGIDNWISVDVTWGESGPALIGGTLNHFFTHVASTDPNSPALVERTSYGGESELEPPEFEIIAVSTLPNSTNAQNTEQLLAQYGSDGETSLLDTVEFQRNSLAIFLTVLSCISLMSAMSLGAYLGRRRTKH